MIKQFLARVMAALVQRRFTSEHRAKLVALVTAASILQWHSQG